MRLLRSTMFLVRPSYLSRSLRSTAKQPGARQEQWLCYSSSSSTYSSLFRVPGWSLVACYGRSGETTLHPFPASLAKCPLDIGIRSTPNSSLPSAARFLEQSTLPHRPLSTLSWLLSPSSPPCLISPRSSLTFSPGANTSSLGRSGFLASGHTLSWGSHAPISWSSTLSTCSHTRIP